MITTEVKEVGDLDKLLATMPMELQHKQLKAALGKAVRVMAREARQRAPEDPYGDDDVHIKRSIRTSTKFVGEHLVRAWASVRGRAASYALALEYGHDVYSGERNTGKRTEDAYFWRPAADVTQEEQHRAVTQYLKSKVRELARH